MNGIKLGWKYLNKIIGLLLLVVFLASTTSVWAAPASPSKILSWEAPTTNADGTPPGHLDGSTLTDLAGYKVYLGTGSGVYDVLTGLDVGNVLTYTVGSPVVTADGTYCFTVTAYDTSNNESAYALPGEACFPLDVPDTVAPAPARNLTAVDGN